MMRDSPVTEREALGEALSTIEDFGQFRILFRSWIGVDRVLLCAGLIQ